MIRYTIGIILTVTAYTNGANILCFFVCDIPSHLPIHMSHVNTLLDRGYNVTVVTSLPLPNKDPRIHHVYIPPDKSAFKRRQDALRYLIGGGLVNHYKFSAVYMEGQYEFLKDSRFKDFMKDSGNKYDLIIVGYCFSDLCYGLALHFKCPVILSVSSMHSFLSNRHVGSPIQLSYIPISTLYGTSHQISFQERTVTFIYGVITIIVILGWVDWNTRNHYSDLFPPTKYGPFEEALSKLSLIFVNQHFSEGTVQPNVPALIEVGGIQLKPEPDPLPSDLAQIFDSSSEYGVIYVCFGSYVGSDITGSQFPKIIYDVFAGLNETVIWKWNDELFGNASNIHWRSWLPQTDILAHPNTKLFITHAGRGGVSEAYYHGVPMLAIPFLGDQPTNAFNLEANGYGLSVDYTTTTVESFRATILEILNNPKYAENTQRLSKLYRDRPMSPRNTSAYWIEYVIRNKGAYHIKSRMLQLNIFQYFCLDVIAFLVIVCFIVYKVLTMVTKFLITKCCKKSKIKKQ